MKTDAYKPQHLKPKKRRLLTTGSLLCYLLIAVVMSTGASFSKYTTSVSGSDSARVARFEVSHELDNLDEMSLSKSSDFKTITLINDSEVSVRYSIKVVTSKALPAGTKLTLDGELFTANGSDTVFLFENVATIRPGDSAEDVTLVVDSSDIIAGYDGTIAVSAVAEQVN